VNERNHENVNFEMITHRQWKGSQMTQGPTDLMWDYVGLGSGAIGVSGDDGWCSP